MAQTKNEESIKATSERKDPNVSVHSFSEVELPVASEKSYEDFVTYGDDNLFPQHMIEAWLQSPVHNALTTGIIQMIAGDGIEFNNKVVEVETFRKKVNKNGDSLEDLINKTSFDLYLHGYYAWTIIWNRARTKIVEINHVPAEQVRSGKVNDETMKVDEYYVSWDWSQYRKKKFKPKKIPAFSPTNRMDPEQMIFVKQYRPSQYYYSTPSYIGGMNWILLDNRIGEFHLNNIENGFFPSSIVQFFNGEPEQDKKRAIEQNFMNKFTGKKQAKMVFIYNNNKEQQVAFDTYEPAGIEKRFKELMPAVSQNIMIAHRVPSPLLFGIRDGGGLGNNAEELESSSLLMNKMVIIPMQNIILQTLGQVFKVNNWPVEVTIETLQPAQWLKGNNDDAEADTEEQSKFSKQGINIVPENLTVDIITHLKAKGDNREAMEEEGWVLIQDDDTLTAEGIKLRIMPVTFAEISSDPEDPSYLDTGLYKIRYEYRGPEDDKNRDFCGSVLGLNLIYRKEDIDTMSDEGANPDFGAYSIWDYKGSFGCRHRWHRLVFFRKRSPKGTFLPSDGLLNDKPVSPGNTPASVIPDDKTATKVNP